jgi:hypothetical protein
MCNRITLSLLALILAACDVRQGGIGTSPSDPPPSTLEKIAACDGVKVTQVTLGVRFFRAGVEVPCSAAQPDFYVDWIDTIGSHPSSRILCDTRLSYSSADIGTGRFTFATNSFAPVEVIPSQGLPHTIVIDGCLLGRQYSSISVEIP